MKFPSSIWRIVRRIFLAVFLAAFALFLIFVLPLFFCERQLPESWVRAAADAASDDEIVTSIGSISLKLPEGIRVRNVRIFDKKAKSPAPLLSFESADVRISLPRLVFDRNSALKRIRIFGASMPRMPDSWYEPVLERKEEWKPVDFSEVPELRPFSLELYDANILGIRAESATIDAVSVSPRGISAEGFRLVWPDTDRQMSLNGRVNVDASTQMLKASLSGETRLAGIRPLLVALNVKGAVDYIDSFTALDHPIPVNAAIEANIANSDFGLTADLKTTGGTCSGVPLDTIYTKLRTAICTRGSFYNLSVALENTDLRTADGSTASGTVVYEYTNDVESIKMDVSALMPPDEITALADFLNNGELDVLKTEGKASVSVSGIVYTAPEKAADNKLKGTLKFGRTEIAGIKAASVESELALSGTSVSFGNINAVTPQGGKCFGDARLDIPDFDPARISLWLSMNGKKVPLGDVCDALHFKLDNATGLVDFDATVSMPLDDSMMEGLNGKGSVKCHKGVIVQLPIFAGFTSYVARNVPGVSSLTDQSNANCTFTITNGVMRMPDVLVEGRVFSIRGKGLLNLPADELDFTVRATVFREGSFLSVLTSPVTWTFTKLLLEFRVHGPFEKPQWDSVTVLDRIMDAFSLSEEEKLAPPKPRPGAKKNGAPK